jgi:hypothetical protein
MKTLNVRERNRRKILNMYKSVENKLHGSDLIWWNSLTIKARYSFVFSWRYYHKSFPNNKFKHFLKSKKLGYVPNLQNKRNAVIDHLID